MIFERPLIVCLTPEMYIILIPMHNVWPPQVHTHKSGQHQARYDTIALPIALSQQYTLDCHA